MSNRIPIVKVGDVLLVSIQTDLGDDTAIALQEDLSNRIVETGAKGVIIDISALEIVDSFIGRMLSVTASMAHVLDADTVVVGMRPAVAITLAELGLYLEKVRTALNAEMAFDLLARRFAERGEGASADGTGAGEEPLAAAAESA
ncbi:MAG TPA: STAS domain-containing protein [Candidatus Baltobacteraceae bacterium]|nr:STAS domain-containing protein [Candidatus Baltobacteraceae bacterium]